MRFVPPQPDAFLGRDVNFRDGFASYSLYNYLRPGPIAWLKRRRFETALRLAAPWPRSSYTSAIDFGCADGVFLPTLAACYERVTGIEIDPRDCVTAKKVAAECGGRVNVVCNAGLDAKQLREHVAPHGVLFLLETLEHVESRIAFLRDLFTLLIPSGLIVLSVPKMVGPAFLAKYVTQTALRMPHEEIGWADVFRAGLLFDTERLEPTWFGGHRGFNHRTLERTLRQEFRVLRSTHSLTSAFYVLRAR